jgi:hypothetical protein
MAIPAGLAILACGVLIGCGGSSGSAPPSPKGISVAVAPSSFTMGVGSNYQFVATVTGTSNTAVQWQVNGMGGGAASAGIIDNAGLYIAPANIPAGPIEITAVAQADGVSKGSAAVTLTLTDPLGTASGQTITCPADPNITIGGTCYSVALSCAGIADFNASLWVNTPTTTPVGTVMLTSGGNGDGLYWNSFAFGSNVVNGLLQAGYITVQTSFGQNFTNTPAAGWVAGPGGIRRVACRYAALAKWVQDHINPSATAMCATGNSGGAALIGYALTHYGEESLFKMVEPTSGSPISRLDYSCECSQPDLPDPCHPSQLATQCAGLDNAEKFIDPAYTAPICSQAVRSHSTANSAQFLSDSALSPEATLAYPHTAVHFLWGGQDVSSAPVMGQLWQEAITQQLIPQSNAFACVADAPHPLADVLDGRYRS